MYYLIIGSPPWYFEISNFKFTETKFKNELIAKREHLLTFGVPGFREFNDEHI